MQTIINRQTRILMLTPLIATLGACSQPDENTSAQQTQDTVTEPGAVALMPAEGPPRFEDGTVNLGPVPGSMGFWTASVGRLVNNPDSYPGARAKTGARVEIADAPLQPWTLALTNHRQNTFIATEPYARCKPAGGPRQIMSPYGFEIVQMPEIQRAYILTVANAMSYRTIYMDGRAHPEEILLPSYLGHSVGHWEGDTLVVDTVGFSERSWTNREGLPTTDQLHLIERFTRTSLDEMDYTFTIDDPNAYTAPWTTGFGLEWNADMEVFEYICQENNISPAGMIGEERISVIVP